MVMGAQRRGLAARPEAKSAQHELQESVVVLDS